MVRELPAHSWQTPMDSYSLMGHVGRTQLQEGRTKIMVLFPILYDFFATKWEIRKVLSLWIDPLLGKGWESTIPVSMVAVSTRLCDFWCAEGCCSEGLSEYVPHFPFFLSHRTNLHLKTLISQVSFRNDFISHMDGD